MAQLANEVQARLRAAGVLDGPLYCAEVGARKPPSAEGSRERFYALDRRRILAFEADAAEAARLSQVLAPDSGIEVVGTGLGARDGRQTLYVTRNPSCSSLLKPDDAVLDCYTALDVARLARAVEIELATLDSVFATRGWPRIDFLKMDVQGAECDILAGARAALGDTVVVVAEVAFRPLYSAQPMFGDVHEALRSRGFEFYRFLHLGGRARTSTRDDQMQTLWGDALFVRSPESVTGVRAAALAVFATLYDALDVAEIALRRAHRDTSAWFREAIRTSGPGSGPGSLQSVRRGIRRVIGRIVAGARA